MAPENLSPLEELKRLEQRLDDAHTVGDLQPLFGRAEEIAQKYTADFDVQLASHELKQKILALGSKLRPSGGASPTPPASSPMPSAGTPSVTPPPTPVPPVSYAKPPAHFDLDESTLAIPSISGYSEPPPRPTTPIAQTPPRKEPPKSAAKGPGAKSDVPSPKAAPEKKATSGVVIAWVLASLVVLAGAGIAVSVIHDRGDRAAATTLMDVRISTTPPGASIAVNDQQTCISDCVAKLLPGTYQVSATLDGYDAVKSQLTVGADESASLDLKLQPQAARVRVVAELREGQVFLDDKLAGDLQDGSFTIEQVAPGTHTLRIAGGGSEAGFQFSAPAGSMPTVEGPIATKDLLAAVVLSAGGQARMVTSTGPLKLAVNGAEQPVAATPEGVDLQGYRAGTDQFVLSQGTKDHTLSETFGMGAGLTVFLQTDQNIGTLVIATGQDNVRVFLNDREAKARTQRGELRVQTIGKVNVRIAKDGFEEVPPQTASVAKGAETRLTFAMKTLPQFASMVIMGATPGADVLLDQRMIGSIAPDGTFRNSSIPPGDHTIDLRRDQYDPKRLTKAFRAGQAVTIAGSEAVLTSRVVAPPAAPPAATPTKAPAPEAVKPPVVARTAASGDMSNFDVPSAWRQENDVWRHRGAATLTYGLKPSGVFTFSIYLFKGGNLFRGGRVRWFLNYTNANNYLLFELDEETFWAKTVTNGKTVERKKFAHKQDKNLRVWNIQIDVTKARITHKVQGDGGWIDLDNWSDPSRDFTDGKFGFLVNGNDEIGLSNFHFAGR